MLRPVCKSYYSLLCCVNNGCSIEFLLEITSVFTVDDFESRSCYFYAESLSVSSITTYLLTTLRVLPLPGSKKSEGHESMSVLSSHELLSSSSDKLS